jgi:hypothetical protein
MMPMQPSVFVFTCGTPDLYGLSAQQDGSNLPKVHDCTEAWKFLQAVPMVEEFLKRFAMDPKITILNLAARGYHIGSTSAEVLDFPHPHRSST